MIRAWERGSTADLVDVEHLEGGVATLVTGRKRAALEVEPGNLLLQGDEERDAIWRRFRRALAALACPISLYSTSSPRREAPRDDGPDARFLTDLLGNHGVHRQRHLAVVWDEPTIHLGRALETRHREARGPLEQRAAAVSSGLAGAGLRNGRLGDGAWLSLLQEHTGGRSGRLPADFRSWLAPDRAVVDAHQLRLPGRLARSLVVTGFPRRLELGWLAPLVLSPPCAIRLAQHIYPVPKLASLGHLRRRIRSFETSLEVDRIRGRRPDGGTRAALGDALELEERVLLEEERLLRVMMCATLEAPSQKELEAGWNLVLSSLAELGCTPTPLVHRQVDGWRATLPLGVDPIGWGRDMTAGALATALPFMRATLSEGSGALLGPSLISRELVAVNPFSGRCPNHNTIVLGTSGGGKSFTSKLFATRLAALGCRVRCVDPSGEYRALAELLRGSFIELGGGEAGGLNPLGPTPGGGGDDRRPARALDLVSGLSAAVGSAVAPDARREMGTVIQELLAADPEAADLPRLVAALERSGMGMQAKTLRQLTEGPDRGIFSGRAAAHLGTVAVLSLRLLQHDRERVLGPAIEMLLWHLEADLESAPAGINTVVLFDEAEQLLSVPASAKALERMARRVRKLGGGLLVVSQVVEDFLGSAVGNVIIRNCHTKLLLRQEAVAIPALRRAFGLTPSECDLLRDAAPGCGLVIVGTERAAFRGAAPPEWHEALASGTAQQPE